MMPSDELICRLLHCDDTRHHCGHNRHDTPSDQLGSTTDPTSDPLLTALAHCRGRREQARTRLRLLLAYAREFTYPRPYTLAALADAADMSISGVRTGYHHDDIATITQRLSARPSRASNRAPTRGQVTP